MRRSFYELFAALAALTGVALSLSANNSASAKNLLDFFSSKHMLKDTQPAKSREAADNIVSSEIVIKAPVDVVWKTVHLERDCAPNLVFNNLLEANDNHAVFEQKWCVIPVISQTTCIMDERDFPNERIEFKLLKSDQFKRMEGSWSFAAADDGKATKLTLSAHLELRGMCSKSMLNAVAKKKMDKRLAHVKELAEQPRAEMKVNASLL
jgi:hypothetical protein